MDDKQKHASPARDLQLSGGRRFVVEAHPGVEEGAFYTAVWPTDLGGRPVVGALSPVVDLGSSKVYGTDPQLMAEEARDAGATAFVPFATAMTHLADPSLEVHFLRLQWDTSALVWSDARVFVGPHVAVQSGAYDRAEFETLVLATGSDDAKVHVALLLDLVESHAAGCWTPGTPLPMPSARQPAGSPRSADRPQPLQYAGMPAGFGLPSRHAVPARPIAGSVTAPGVVL